MLASQHIARILALFRDQPLSSKLVIYCPQSSSSTHICFDNILLKSEYLAMAHYISQPSLPFLVFFLVFTVHTCLYPEVHQLFSHMHSPNLHPPFGTCPSNCFCGQWRRCDFLKIQVWTKLIFQIPFLADGCIIHDTQSGM
jgi:hypothetical protein